MGRRTRLKENTQKAKHMKRPRSWHRKGKKSVLELWREVEKIKNKPSSRRSNRNSFGGEDVES